MGRPSWKYAILLFEGAVTSIAAHMTAWMAIAFLTFLCQFLGHVAGVMGVHILSAFIGH
jgi:hypothetical protein